MNLSRNPRKGSDSSRDLAYSSQSASWGKPYLFTVALVLLLSMTGVELLSRIPGAITLFVVDPDSINEIVMV